MWAEKCLVCLNPRIPIIQLEKEGQALGSQYRLGAGPPGKSGNRLEFCSTDLSAIPMSLTGRGSPGEKLAEVSAHTPWGCGDQSWVGAGFQVLVCTN